MRAEGGTATARKIEMKFFGMLRGASEPGAKSDIAGEVEGTGGLASQNEPELLSIARTVIMKTFMTGVVKTGALGQPSGDLFDWPVYSLRQRTFAL